MGPSTEEWFAPFGESFRAADRFSKFAPCLEVVRELNSIPHIEWPSSAGAQIDCQTTANHDRTGPVTTDLVSKETLISRGFCCVLINGDRAWNHYVLAGPTGSLLRSAELQTSKPLRKVETERISPNPRASSPMRLSLWDFEFRKRRARVDFETLSAIFSASKTRVRSAVFSNSQASSVENWAAKVSGNERGTSV